MVAARQHLHRAESAILTGNTLTAIAEGAKALESLNALMLWLAEDLERKAV